MKPKIIFSRWTLNQADPFPEMCAASNRLAQAHGYDTILFTDEWGANDLGRIKFTEIFRFDDEELNSLPKHVWSLGKILAMSKMTEPFFHIDFDVFMYKNVLRDFWETPFTTFHYENWGKIMIYFSELNQTFPFRPISLPENYEVESHNFAMVGGSDFENIRWAAEEVLTVCRENKEAIEKMGEEEQYVNLPILAEQCWIPLLLKTKGVEPSYILTHLTEFRDEAKIKGVAHFWTGAKRAYRQEIINYAKKLGVTY